MKWDWDAYHDDLSHCMQQAKNKEPMKYAVIQKHSIHVPGDERSRTNPGHGYPEHTEETISMTEFTDKAKLEQWVRDRIERYNDRNFRVIQFEEMKVETSLSVSLKP